MDRVRRLDTGRTGNKLIAVSSKHIIKQEHFTYKCYWKYLLTANNSSCAEALNRKRDTHHLIKVKNGRLA